ncbi:unnamed protein product [Penicillium nalgiovense]|nr:unnamed protein product [Penicillium nalgiovense]
MRRSHRKSRHGCAECKTRRVKCDEARPSCTNCSKRSTSCNYGSSAPYLWLSEQSSLGPPTSPPNLGPEVDYLFSTPCIMKISKALCDNKNICRHPPSALDLSDLELMLQWSSKTYLTLSRNEATKEVWQFLVPEEALSHPFLMLGLLAVSAIHLADAKGENMKAEFMNKALLYQHQALLIFRELLDDINGDNAKALFAFSSILAIFYFGFLRLENVINPSSCMDNLFQVLTLSEGVQNVLRICGLSIQESNFSPIFVSASVEMKYSIPLPDEVRLAVNRLYTANTAYGVQNSGHDTAVYQEAIIMLEDALNAVYRDDVLTNAACRWAIKCPRQFLRHLQEREPMALVILCFYCVVLHRLRHIWCFEGWATAILKSTWPVLEPQCRHLAHWAATEILGEIHF